MRGGGICGNMRGGGIKDEIWVLTSYSEMAFAHEVLRGNRSDIALLRRHKSETCFGAQVCWWVD